MKTCETPITVYKHEQKTEPGFFFGIDSRGNLLLALDIVIDTISVKLSHH